MLFHTLKTFSQVLAFSLQHTQEYKMHQSPKQSPNCGLFPSVDKRHLQEGISQEQRQAIAKKQSIGDIINNAGVIFFHMFLWAMFFFSLLFFGE